MTPADAGQDTTPADITAQSYQAAADRYAERTPGVGGPRLQFLDRVAEQLPGGRVLELGSGPGWDADHLESRGLEVTRSDIAPAFVEMMRERGRSARLLDVRSDDLGGPWDGVYADAVLLHLSRIEFADVVDRVRRVVRPDGLFAFTLKEGDGEAWTEEKLDLPRYFVFWREEAVRTILTAHGWTVTGLDHWSGRQDWLHVLARAR